MYAFSKPEWSANLNQRLRIFPVDEDNPIPDRNADKQRVNSQSTIGSRSTWLITKSQVSTEHFRFLKSGADADFFVFHGGDGRDTILDLQENDTVQIADWARMDDFLDILSHAKNVGKDVVISSGNDALVIKGLHKTDLDQTNFDFL